MDSTGREMYFPKNHRTELIFLSKRAILLPRLMSLLVNTQVRYNDMTAEAAECSKKNNNAAYLWPIRNRTYSARIAFNRVLMYKRWRCTRLVNLFANSNSAHSKTHWRCSTLLLKHVIQRLQRQSHMNSNIWNSRLRHERDVGLKDNEKLVYLQYYQQFQYKMLLWRSHKINARV